MVYEGLLLQFSPPGLQANKYYWKVQAYNDETSFTESGIEFTFAEY